MNKYPHGAVVQTLQCRSYTSSTNLDTKFYPKKGNELKEFKRFQFDM